MSKHYKSMVRAFFLISIMLLSRAPLWSQTSPIFEEGKLHVMLSEAAAQSLETKELSRDPTGIVISGLPELDHFNRLYKVQGFTRVFPYAGKHEERHRRYGLHLWYELTMM